MAKRNLEQYQIIEAISYFKDIKQQSTETNPKILECFDLIERKLQEDLFCILRKETPTSKKGG